MSIINGTRFQKKEKIKVQISSETLADVDAYRAWAGIDDLGFFLEEAALYVLAKDRAWKQHKKAEKKRASETA